MENEASTPVPTKNSTLPIIIVIVVVLLLAGVGAFFAISSREQQATQNTTQENVTQATPTSQSDTTAPTDSMEAEGNVMSIEIQGKNFEFMPKEIRVKQGDTVRITFNNTQGFHDFVIDELGVKTKQINGPATETVEFVADKIGTFEYYCSVGQHRQMGMTGNLIVE